MKYELIRYKCELNTRINVNLSSELYGDINSLIQVFDNIIINAIQAYEGNPVLLTFILTVIMKTFFLPLEIMLKESQTI